MGRAGAQRGARADDVAAAAGDDPLHADDAVPGAAQGPAAAGAGAGARAYPRGRRARRAHRRAAGERAGGQRGRPAGRVVDRRWPRQRRRAGRGGEGAGGRPMMDGTVNISAWRPGGYARVSDSWIWKVRAPKSPLARDATVRGRGRLTGTMLATRPGRGVSTTTRSARKTASGIEWVTKTIVLRRWLPSPHTRRSSRFSSSRVIASSVPKGSSISRKGGSSRSA